MGVKIPQTFVMTWPVGEYIGQIEKVTAKPGDYGPQLQVAFKLIQMDEKASPVLGWCSQTFSNKSKLYAWTKAAFGGGEIPETYNFDSDDLLGKKVLLTLVIRDREDGTPFNRIDSLRAIPETGEVPDLFET
ncbi:unnamed protein product [marine sediment metagenome]|uniref:Uncharacterized protein n=1 Tax=marine sediment metagenome TaxID=412755 RepID=X1K2L1_9ZZZZ